MTREVEVRLRRLAGAERPESCKGRFAWWCPGRAGACAICRQRGGGARLFVLCGDAAPVLEPCSLAIRHREMHGAISKMGNAEVSCSQARLPPPEMQPCTADSMLPAEGQEREF